MSGDHNMRGERLKPVKPIKLDRNEVRIVLEEALAEDFDQVYIVGFKAKIAHLRGSKLDSNIETLGMIEMMKMQIFERSGLK